MAHVASAPLSADRPSMGTRIASFFVRIMEARGRMLRLEQRHAELNRLMALDDATLARMGLNRHDVPRHVFRDLMIL